MNYCIQCGSPIPEGQHVCSMCYGDPEYGRDGYYRRWLEEEMKRNMLEDMEEDE